MMKQISGNLYQINLGAVNAFVIEDGAYLILIDTGYKGSADKIFKAIEKAGKDPKNISQVILTHTHPDHAGSAAEIKSRLNIPVYAHEEDTKLVENGIAGRLPMVLSPGIINWLVFNIFIKRSPNKVETCNIDKTLKDNDLLPIDGGLRVIHTPGHSLGHIALHMEKYNLLIAGDICANMNGLDLSTVYEDREIGVKSILKAANFNFDKIVFGHGKPIMQNASKILKEKFSNIYYS
jgi:glyoxylase-like metal-dependent hydrolase (beta-lactamase superfamily II)